MPQRIWKSSSSLSAEDQLCAANRPSRSRNSPTQPATDLVRPRQDIHPQRSIVESGHCRPQSVSIKSSLASRVGTSPNANLPIRARWHSARRMWPNRQSDGSSHARRSLKEDRREVPIKIPDDLPARCTLEAEGVVVMRETDAVCSHDNLQQPRARRRRRGGCPAAVRASATMKPVLLKRAQPQNESSRAEFQMLRPFSWVFLFCIGFRLH